MIDPGLNEKVVMVTGGNNPYGIGVVFFASEQAGWITGQLLFVHGGHRMALGGNRDARGTSRDLIWFSGNINGSSPVTFWDS